MTYVNNNLGSGGMMYILIWWLSGHIFQYTRERVARRDEQVRKLDLRLF